MVDKEIEGIRVFNDAECPGLLLTRMPVLKRQIDYLPSIEDVFAGKDDTIYVVAKEKETKDAALGHLADLTNKIESQYHKPDSVEVLVLGTGVDLKGINLNYLPINVRFSRIFPRELILSFMNPVMDKWYAIGIVRHYFSR